MTRKYVRPPERKAYMREYLKKWHAAHPNYRTEYTRKRRAADPERAKAERRAEYLAHRQEYIDRAKRWREANPDRYKELLQKWNDANPHKNREYKLAYEFGIDVDQWTAMLEAQHFCCAICETPLHEIKDTNVDHCHKTGLIRGILCAHCNRGLGQFRDDPHRLRGAIAYLAQHGIVEGVTNHPDVGTRAQTTAADSSC